MGGGKGVREPGGVVHVGDGDDAGTVAEEAAGRIAENSTERRQTPFLFL